MNKIKKDKTMHTLTFDSSGFFEKNLNRFACLGLFLMFLSSCFLSSADVSCFLFFPKLSFLWRNIDVTYITSNTSWLKKKKKKERKKKS